MDDIGFEEPPANRRSKAIFISQVACYALVAVFSIFLLRYIIQKIAAAADLASKTLIQSPNTIFKSENKFVLVKGKHPRLTINNVAKLLEVKGNNGTELRIFSLDRKEKFKFTINILNSKFFSLEKFLIFLKKRYQCPMPEDDQPVNLEINDCIFDTETSYFDYFTTYSEVLNYNSENEPVNISEKIDFGDTDPADLLGRSGAKVIDVFGDGYCFYYSLLFNIYDSLKDPSSKTFKKIFHLEYSNNRQYLSGIKGLDEIRVNLMLSILGSTTFFTLSKHQLFDFVYYFKILIFAELNHNKRNYEGFIGAESFKYDEITLFKYYEWNQNLEPLIISNLLNYGLIIISFNSGITEDQNPRIALNTTKDQQDGMLYLMLIDNSHYNAIIFL